MNTEVVEKSVGAGTNGMAAFKLVHTTGRILKLFEGEGGSGCTRASQEEILRFYRDELALFEGVTGVYIEVNGAEAVYVPIGELWSKAWVRQLNACKCVQWLCAIATGEIHKPRGDKEDGVWPAFEGDM